MNTLRNGCGCRSRIMSPMLIEQTTTAWREPSPPAHTPRVPGRRAASSTDSRATRRSPVDWTLPQHWPARNADSVFRVGQGSQVVEGIGWHQVLPQARQDLDADRFARSEHGLSKRHPPPTECHISAARRSRHDHDLVRQGISHHNVGRGGAGGAGRRNRE